MTELERITQNTTGEIPEGQTTIVRVINIDNPEEVLDNCKSIVMALLNNQNLDPKNPKWRQLLPGKIIRFLDVLDNEDLNNNEDLRPLHRLVEDFQDPELREWEWYSSVIKNQGFEIIFKEWFSFRNYWMIHAQNIPYSKMKITDFAGTAFPSVYRDVTIYKKFE